MLTCQVHIRTVLGQHYQVICQPALGDVAARPVLLEPRTSTLVQQRRHHLPDVVPVARVLRSRVAEPGDDPAFCGQPACSPSLRLSPTSDVSARASGASGAASAPSSADRKSTRLNSSHSHISYAVL